MMFPHGETVTRLRAPLAEDPYSGETIRRDWAGATWPSVFPAVWPDDVEALEIPGCAFDPGGSSEPAEQGRASVTTQPSILAPFGADITATDRVVIRDRTWDVDGDPAAYRNPFTGWEAGLVVKLKAVAG